MFIEKCSVKITNTIDLAIVSNLLHELGYRYYFKYQQHTDNDVCYFVTDPETGSYYIIYEVEDKDLGIYCDTNKDLFLAIAAINDDSDKNQWFIFDSTDCIYEQLRDKYAYICPEISNEEYFCRNSMFLNTRKLTGEEIVEIFINGDVNFKF